MLDPVGICSFIIESVFPSNIVIWSMLAGLE